MKRTKKTRILLAVVLVVAVVLMISVTAFAEDAADVNPFFGTFWSLVPPLVAIILALITKEVYSSLFIGIAIGSLLYSQGNPLGALKHIFIDGFAGQYGETETISGTLTDPYNMGILIFLVFLGILVAMLNESGASTAFGRWSGKKIKTRAAACLATMGLGVLIFIDDYFNCLTVGSVMRPVCDKHQVSRAKLAYLIDATAAPVCIIAPISSWAAAVSAFVPEGYNGILLFVSTIPFNYYALLTIAMMICLVLMNFDYGPMKTHEDNAILRNDLYTTPDRPYATTENPDENSYPNARVIDLVFPIVVLIVTCVTFMVYTGGFFDGGISFVDAFAGCDASVALMLASSISLILSMIYYICRRSLKFSECMDCIPNGFKAMVPAILILALAWTLKSMTDALGSKEFVAMVVKGSAGSFQKFLPAIIFLIGCGISFATGTSWGTFGILIPIVMNVFPEFGSPIQTISIAACMAGAVCGDHCSPISDTTIMASAGAQSNHINHVNTQLPYAMTVAGVSFVSYILAGFIQNVYINLAIALGLMVGVMFILKFTIGKKNQTPAPAAK